MHMSDALVSSPVAAVMGVVSVSLLVLSLHKIKKANNENVVPLMGVMGAFVFAAQMLNFTIPGTGSSGHIVGGILLSAMLGPWAAYVTLASVLVIQALFFADGGLLALGCNLFNMGVLSCLVAYPLAYRPLAGEGGSSFRLSLAAVLACLLGLEMGAFMVTAETEMSGVTALPFGSFLLFMMPIHVLIGIMEGVATAAVLVFMRRYKPDLLDSCKPVSGQHKVSKKVLLVIAGVALLFGGVFSWYASSDPDGLEWSIAKIVKDGEVSSEPEMVKDMADRIQRNTAFLPDYGFAVGENGGLTEEEMEATSSSLSDSKTGTSVAGITGGVIVLLLVYLIGLLFRNRMRDKSV